MLKGYEWMDGELKDNDTDVTLVNNTAKTQRIAVPTGMKWLLFGGIMDNADDVARDCRIDIVNATNERIFGLVVSTAVGASSYMVYPQRSNNARVPVGLVPLPLKEGWQIEFYWAAGGASTGGTARITAIVLEVPV